MKLYIVILLPICLFNLSYSQTNGTYQVEKLHSVINHPITDEISPIVTDNGKTMFFTRAKDPNFNKTLIDGNKDLSFDLDFDRYKKKLETIFSFLADEQVTDVVNSAYNQDIWKATAVIAGRFNQVRQMDYPLNSALTNSACYLNPLTNDLFLVNQFTEDGGISRGFSISSYHTSKGYQHPKDLEIENIEYSGGNLNMCLSDNGKNIIFSSSHEGNPDLYIADRASYFKWINPRKLSSAINTDQIESSPFLLSKDRLLFFTSSRDNGNADLYVSIRLGSDWSVWSKPYKLPEPVNTNAKEGGAYFHAGFLYFASDRDGSWDIFRTKFNPKTFVDDFLKSQRYKPIVSQQIRKTETPTQPMDTNLVIKNEVSSKPPLNEGKRNTEAYPLNIKLFDAITTQPISGQLSMAQSQTGTNRLQIPNTGLTFGIDSSHFKMNTFVFSKEEYFPVTQPYYFRPKEVNMNIFLMPKKENINLVTQPVLFERAEDKILEKSYPILNHIANQLMQYKSIYIHIEGHTDNVGDHDKKMELSQKRAEAIFNYLKMKGISTERMTFEGYGDTRPIASNDTETNREKNRRVEIKIVKTE